MPLPRDYILGTCIGVKRWGQIERNLSQGGARAPAHRAARGYRVALKTICGGRAPALTAEFPANRENNREFSEISGGSSDGKRQFIE
jgi:hypothetical protein